MADLPDDSIDLVVTSPPYPMIEMWDDMFAAQNARIGDATRTIAGRFALYPNHARIHSCMQRSGFTALPSILWRKQTNAPTKFMGSGMMPPGAYVTLEHEYVLIFRKGNKREFRGEKEKRRRLESAFFWEERNVWFSDIWMDVKGASQSLFEKKTRERSAAFPFELPYRLIAMFSVKGDTGRDPFLGIGTTVYAAMAEGRNGLGYEIDPHLREVVFSRFDGLVGFSNRRISDRLRRHLDFVATQSRKTGRFKYVNRHYRFPVVTNQETGLIINELESVRRTGDDTVEVTYSERPREDFKESSQGHVMSAAEIMEGKKPAAGRNRKKDDGQRHLFGKESNRF